MAVVLLIRLFFSLLVLTNLSRSRLWEERVPACDSDCESHNVKPALNCCAQAGYEVLGGDCKGKNPYLRSELQAFCIKQDCVIDGFEKQMNIFELEIRQLRYRVEQLENRIRGTETENYAMGLNSDKMNISNQNLH